MQAIMRYELVINEALRSALMFDTPDEQINEFIRFFGKDTFNKLGYKTKINTHITSCINLFLDIYLYSEYRLIYC